MKRKLPFPLASIRSWAVRWEGIQGAPEKELLGELELRPLPRMDADGDVRMAERSSRPSSCRILHMTGTVLHIHPCGPRMHGFHSTEPKLCMLQPRW